MGKKSDSIQTRRGSGKNKHKKYRWIQPYLPNGKRISINLGTMSIKRAESAAEAVYDLIESLTEDVEPKAASKSWLTKTATEKVCKTLLQHGIIKQLPTQFKSVDASDQFRIQSLVSQFIASRGANQAQSTITIYKKSERDLTNFFGKECDIRKLTVKDGREFWAWLNGGLTANPRPNQPGSSTIPTKSGRYAENTSKQRFRYARAFFEIAIEDELILKNPFKPKGISTAQNPAEKAYVSKEKIKKVISACPTLEWQLFFLLVRNISLRIPSEIRMLTWDDIDFKRKSILIHSPKTESKGKSARRVRLFETLIPWLEYAKQEFSQSSEFVFPDLHKKSNPGKSARDIVESAGVETWPNFFNSIRATVLTDHMDQYGIRKAVQWAGNSVDVAMRTYALVRKEDFADVGDEERSDTKSGAKFDANFDYGAMIGAEIDSDA